MPRAEGALMSRPHLVGVLVALSSGDMRYDGSLVQVAQHSAPLAQLECIRQEQGWLALAGSKRTMCVEPAEVAGSYI